MAEIIIDILLFAVLLTGILFPRIACRQEKGALTGKQKKVLKRIRIAAALALVLQLVPEGIFALADGALGFGLGRWLRFAGYFTAYIVIGHDILKKAWKGIKRRQVFDENFLMTVATVGAMALAVTQTGDYLEAVAVMLFYQLGELFQGYAVGRSRRSIGALMDIRPDYVNLEKDGTLVRVDPETVEPGTLIVVQPGEKIPLDGVVVEGTAILNTVALTGESAPRQVQAGDGVLSGCVDLSGLLRVRTTRPFGESTASKILELVENAGSRKSRSENFISKFARVYTPAVCLGALALAVLPPVWNCIAGNSPGWGAWVYRALTFLVISCPCALVISIPLTFFAGVGGAGRAGILIKGSNYLEALSKTRTVVMDKTGTLTQGVFAVERICPEDLEPERLLELAALAESASGHPISKSLLEAYGKPVDRNRVRDVTEQGGYGIRATVDGVSVAVGNRRLMEQLGLPITGEEPVGTAVYVAVDGRYAGAISICDRIKQTAPAALEQLKRAGVSETVMLTGDTRAVAEQVGATLGIDSVYSGLLPADKVQQVEALLQREDRRGVLVFVGDGINDAPVLARADVGIAMGAMGSDAAIEAADVVLMDDDPRKIALGIRLARRCMAIVYENIVFALGVKGLCLLLGAMGIANMWVAIFADVGVMVLAVLNAIRALKAGRS